MDYREPWRADPVGRLGITSSVRNNNGEDIAEIKRDPAERIVLCVNFCAGVDDTIIKNLLNKGGLRKLLETAPNPAAPTTTV